MRFWMQRRGYNRKIRRRWEERRQLEINEEKRRN